MTLLYINSSLLPSSYGGVVDVWFSAISKPQQHDWSLGRRSSIISRTLESVSICTLGVTGAIVGGAPITTGVLATTGVLVKLFTEDISKNVTL